MGYRQDDPYTKLRLQNARKTKRNGRKIWINYQKYIMKSKIHQILIYFCFNIFYTKVTENRWAMEMRPEKCWRGQAPVAGKDERVPGFGRRAWRSTWRRRYCSPFCHPVLSTGISSTGFWSEVRKAGYSVPQRRKANLSARKRLSSGSVPAVEGEGDCESSSPLQAGIPPGWKKL